MWDTLIETYVSRNLLSDRIAMHLRCLKCDTVEFLVISQARHAEALFWNFFVYLLSIYE
jgi:hypothetical protein